MKLRLLLAAVGGLLTAQHSHAQQTSWCPPGAIWQYNVVAMGGTGTVTTRYAGDTIVGGHPAQVLRHSDSDVPTWYVRASNDSVYFWSANRYHLLYRFNAQPGDTWQTYAATAFGTCSQTPVTFRVDSVGTQTLSGRSLRWLGLSITAGGFPGVNYWGRIYEGIGGVRAFQPSSPQCGGTDPELIMNLRSFRATGWTALGSASFGGALQVLATAEARAAQAGFTAYPNPTAGLLTLEVAAPLPGTQITVHDLTGRQLRRQALPASHQLDLRGLPGGTYLLTLESSGQPALTRRITVQ